MAEVDTMEERGRPWADALARCALAWGVVCVAVLGVVLNAPEDEPELLLHVCAAVLVALGLGLHGVALNDLLDMRRDQVLHPMRSLAAGRAGPAQAALVSTAALILAMLGAAMLGGQSIWMVVTLAAALLVHNAMTRFIPAIGLLVPGLLIAALAMLTGWPPAWPWLVWSLLSIVTALTLLVHVFGAKRPRASRRALLGLLLEWIIVSAVLLILPLRAQVSQDASSVFWLWPTIAVVVLVVGIARRMLHVRSRHRLVDRMLRTAGLWMGWYAAAWCLAAGRTGWAVVFALASSVALLALIGLREILAGDRGAPQWQ